jgi:hypothetical protein
VQRRGSSVRTIPPVIPAALAGVSTAVVRVGDHGLFERGDTVMAKVGGKVVYALVQDVAPGGELVCVLWQPLENLSAPWQLDSLPRGGASFAGSAGVLELVLTTVAVSIDHASVFCPAWACPAELFSSGAVVGLGNVFQANLSFNGSFLQRLPVAFFDINFMSQQAQILSDRIAVADCISGVARMKRDNVTAFIRVSRPYWQYVKRLREEEARVSNRAFTVSRPIVDGDISTRRQAVVETMIIEDELESDVRQVEVRIGSKAITGAGSNSFRSRPRATGDNLHTVRRVTFKWHVGASTLQVSVSSVKTITGEASTAPLHVEAPPIATSQGGAYMLGCVFGQSFTYENSRVKVTSGDSAGMTVTLEDRRSPPQERHACLNAVYAAYLIYTAD